MDNEITIDINEVRKQPMGSIRDAEVIRQIALFTMKNKGHNDLTDRIDPKFAYAGLYPHVMTPYNSIMVYDITTEGKHILDKISSEMNTENLKKLKNKLNYNEKLNKNDRTIISSLVKKEIEKTVLTELGIEGDVIGMFPYGSRVYGTADENSDHDYIIVMKGAMLDNGAFRNNAISNADWTIQGVVYSRGGFLNAINSYEIAALECLSLSDSQVITKKWPFKITNWNTKEMVKAIIRKASDSRHLSKMQSKNGDKERAIKSMFHSLRILHFGLQLKEHQKIVNFQECNKMYKEFKSMNPDDFDSRDYLSRFDELLIELRK